MGQDRGGHAVRGHSGGPGRRLRPQIATALRRHNPTRIRWNEAEVMVVFLLTITFFLYQAFKCTSHRDLPLRVSLFKRQSPVARQRVAYCASWILMLLVHSSIWLTSTSMIWPSFQPRPCQQDTLEVLFLTITLIGFGGLGQWALLLFVRIALLFRGIKSNA